VKSEEWKEKKEKRKEKREKRIADPKG